MDGFIVFLVIMAVLTPLYWLPTIIAVRRHKANAKVIGLLNFVSGWTVAMWFALLIASLSTTEVDQMQRGVSVHLTQT